MQEHSLNKFIAASSALLLFGCSVLNKEPTKSLPQYSSDNHPICDESGHLSMGYWVVSPQDKTRLGFLLIYLKGRPDVILDKNPDQSEPKDLDEQAVVISSIVHDLIDSAEEECLRLKFIEPLQRLENGHKVLSKSYALEALKS